MAKKLQESSATEQFVDHLKYPKYSLILEPSPFRELAEIPSAALVELLAKDDIVETLKDTRLQNRSALGWQERQNSPLVHEFFAAIETCERANPTIRLRPAIAGDETASIILRPQGKGAGIESDKIRLLAERTLALGEAVPAVLTAFIPRLLAAADATDQRLADLLQTERALRLARLNLRQAKVGALDALAQLRAELTRLFPRNREFVNQFFLPIDYGRETKDDENQGPETPPSA